MDNNILATLQSIEEQTARLNKVAFVFHPWIEFNNLGNDGFRIPAVQSANIPRLTLIPLVSLNVKHIESRKNLSNNKYVPLPIAYTRSIYSSYIDLLQRYGRYGLVIIPSLGCNLNEAVRISEGFEKIMEPFHNGGLLEDLPEYFGEKSPVEDQLESRVKRIKTTAEARIKSLVTHMGLTEEDAERFREALPVLADSAVKAHRAALTPSNGILPQSIEEINDKRKPKFDEVDTFLRRQFPGYNSDSMLSKRNSNSDLAALTEVLRDLVNQRGAPAAEVDNAIAAALLVVLVVAHELSRYAEVVQELQGHAHDGDHSNDHTDVNDDVPEHHRRHPK